MTLIGELRLKEDDLKVAEANKLRFGTSLSNCQAELTRCGEQLEKIDPLLNKKDRYDATRSTLVKGIIDIYYSVKSFFNRENVTSLQGRVQKLKRDESDFTLQSGVTDAKIITCRQEIAALNEKILSARARKAKLEEQTRELQAQVMPLEEQVRLSSTSQFDRSAHYGLTNSLLGLYFATTNYLFPAKAPVQTDRKPELERLQKLIAATEDELRKIDSQLTVASTEDVTPIPEEPTSAKQLDINFKVMLGAIVELKSGKQCSFSDYLYKYIFMQDKLVKKSYDPITHQFELEFSEERKILLKEMPPGKSPAVQKLLKMVIGTTLVVGKKVTGKFDLDNLSIDLDPDSFKITWWPLTAQLKKIAVAGNFTDLIMTGSFKGKEGDGRIKAQDFVDTLEHNLN
jgi:hypothetical protein